MSSRIDFLQAFLDLDVFWLRQWIRWFKSQSSLSKRLDDFRVIKLFHDQEASSTLQCTKKTMQTIMAYYSIHKLLILVIGYIVYVLAKCLTVQESKLPKYYLILR
jgi:hypothetical protein